MVGSLKNVLSGAIILLQGDDFSFWKVLLKIQNISNLCSSPAVDGLVIISDHTDVPMGFHHLFDELILDQVGILKFIHHHIAAELPIRPEDLWKAFEKNRYKSEKVSKVESIVPMEIFLIALIN
jgi:hypothetical protein